MRKYPLLIPVLFSFIYWFLDTIINKIFFYKDMSILDLILVGSSIEEFLNRITIVLIIFVSYFVINVVMKKSYNYSKALEKKLLESQERYDMVWSATSDGLWDLDMKSDKFYFGPKFYSMLGYEDNEFEPTFDNLIKLIHEDDMENVVNVINIITEGKSNIFEIELRVVTKSGDLKWILSRGKVVTTKVGNKSLRRIIGTNVDITRRKKIEQELEVSEQKLRTTFENISDGILVFSKDLRLELINTSASNIIHYTEEEAIGKHVDEIFPIESFTYHGETMGNLLYEVLTKKKNKTIEKAIFHCIGKRSLCSSHKAKDIHIEDGISLVQNDFGLITGIVIVFRDITEKVKSEDINRKLQEKLQHSSKMEAIDQFSGGIAHDFNNIITAINGFNEIMLLDINENDKHYQDVLEIRTACDRAASLTAKLNAFNRKQIINPEIVDINKNILDFKFVAERIVDEDIQIKYDLNSRKKILVDKTQFDQILLNLIGNAKDAINDKTNKANEKIINIKTTDIEVGDDLFQHNISMEHGKYVLLEVEDSGMGMDDEIIEKIFDPFFTTKDKGKGTGLGLSIVYGIVIQHSGAIFVESKVGVGSKFKIYFPESEYQNEDDRKDYTIIEHNTGIINSEKILLVEDEKSVQRLLVNHLSNLGYKITTCNNGEEAIDIWGKDKFDLIITDVIMPKMSGYELIEKINKIDKNVSVLYISGYNPHTSLLGKNFISKPFSLKLLTDKIRMILNEKNNKDNLSIKR